MLIETKAAIYNAIVIIINILERILSFLFAWCKQHSFIHEMVGAFQLNCLDSVGNSIQIVFTVAAVEQREFQYSFHNRSHQILLFMKLFNQSLWMNTRKLFNFSRTSP